MSTTLYLSQGKHVLYVPRMDMSWTICRKELQTNAVDVDTYDYFRTAKCGTVMI